MTRQGPLNHEPGRPTLIMMCRRVENGGNASKPGGGSSSVEKAQGQAAAGRHVCVRKHGCKLRGQPGRKKAASRRRGTRARLEREAGRGDNSKQRGRGRAASGKPSGAPGLVHSAWGAERACMRRCWGAARFSVQVGSLMHKVDAEAARRVCAARQVPGKQHCSTAGHPKKGGHGPPLHAATRTPVRASKMPGSSQLRPCK